jgi:hypothetical protein
MRKRNEQEIPRSETGVSEYLHDLASIRHRHVEDSSDYTSCCEEHRESSEVFFEIASCHDEIELHFSLATAKDRENSLYKANKLAEVVNAFRDAIEKEVGIINERQSIQQHARAAAAVH